MSDYPTSIDTPKVFENLPGIVNDPADKKTIFAEDLNALGDDIVAVQTVLGTSPQGAYASVKARLTAITSKLYWVFASPYLYYMGGNVGIGTMTPAVFFSLIRSTNGRENITLQNPNTGTSAYTSFSLSSSGSTMALYHFGGSYSTSGRYIQDSTVLENSGQGGLSFSASSSSAPIRFYTRGNSLRMFIASNGDAGFGTSSPTSKIHVVGIPAYANDAAAGVGGLTAGAFYQVTGTGVLMVKQ